MFAIHIHMFLHINIYDKFVKNRNQYLKPVKMR